MKNPAAGGSGVETSSNFPESLLGHPDYSRAPPSPLPAVGRVGRQQRQQQQAAGDTMAQTAPTPLRSLLEIAWKCLTVSPRQRLIYAQTPLGSTGFHIVSRISLALQEPAWRLEPRRPIIGRPVKGLGGTLPPEDADAGTKGEGGRCPGGPRLPRSGPIRGEGG